MNNISYKKLLTRNKPIKYLLIIFSKKYELLENDDGSSCNMNSGSFFCYPVILNCRLILRNETSQLWGGCVCTGIRFWYNRFRRGPNVKSPTHTVKDCTISALIYCLSFLQIICSKNNFLINPMFTYVFPMFNHPNKKYNLKWWKDIMHLNMENDLGQINRGGSDFIK